MGIIPKFIRVEGRLRRIKKHDENLSYLLPPDFWNPLHWVGLTSAYLFPSLDQESNDSETQKMENDSNEP